ncbi:MAG: glycerol-3-phosphate 1-O-acyltransferase PlsY [Oscillospiraceae bacterium]|nr:glycerol-3-phosphate 1-O-acyltransferase PlsY [Oscillospiraceae bacterium]
MSIVLQAILCCVIGYILGSLSPAYVLARKKGYDIREEGSGNAGATNAFILLGKNAFFLTAILDILKAFAAYRLCQILFPAIPVAGPIAGTAAVLGHIYPVFLNFNGGKGLASLGGVILAWNWKWFFILLAVAILIAFGTRYVSLVAPSISILFPACYYWRTGLFSCTLILLIPAIPVFVKHWENFVRIHEGTEMRTRFIWDKEGELKRIGMWNPKTESQLDRRGKKDR